LKRYPNTVIFAQKAISAANPEDDPEIDLELDENEFKEQVKFPQFKAEISPDIKFFGFDLTIDQARGQKKPQALTMIWAGFLYCRKFQASQGLAWILASIKAVMACHGTILHGLISQQN